MNEKVKSVMVKMNLWKFWKVGSDQYPNIISAYISDNQLVCEYLQLDGWTKIVKYDL